MPNRLGQATRRPRRSRWIGIAVPCAVCVTVAATVATPYPGFDPGGSGPVYPDQADGRKTTPPSITAHRVPAGTIHIDGLLDESEWAAAPAGTGFTQFEPDRRGEPGEETVFKVLYDDDAIYFGIACCRDHGTATTTCLSRRDHITGSDLVRLYLSPYHDMVTGYHFRINPDGVKEDYYNYGDLYHDASWDAVWEADTSRDPDGWYAEIRLPFSSIRYRPAASMTWGLNLFQHIYTLGQRTAWSNWDRDQQGFMSRSGTVTGLDGIRPPRQLEIMPYVVGRTTDPSDPAAHGPSHERWDNQGNFGADLKYGVTADLTLNATFQPDFGQVEADPSVLNLSPFETYYEEKRPFFIEGAQFFVHPNFNMFYSRRIGTGRETSRIRYAGKLTGKTLGKFSTAVLVAATDESREGQAHNPFLRGDRRATYAIGRFGRQFHHDLHHVNVMQTAVVRDPASFDGPVRTGYTTGGDFELNFHDRMYQVSGSLVGSVIDPHRPEGRSAHDPAPVYGTGSRLEVKKSSGDWRAALTTRHQSDRLDLNDLGYITDPDHYAVQAWVTRVFNADDEGESFLSSGSTQLRVYRSWIYAGRRQADPADPARDLWSYDRGHDLLTSWSFDGDLTTRGFAAANLGVTYEPRRSNLYITRRAPGGERGPLMVVPAQLEGYLYANSDSRKNHIAGLGLEWNRDTAGGHRARFNPSLSGVWNGRMTYEVGAGIEDLHDDAQWIGNVENPGGGIGGVSYLFAELDQSTWDLTLRSSLLFTRDQSLELYCQPFLTVGSYRNPRELARADTRDLRAYAGVDPAAGDFSYGAVNLNLVYRWEYRPGSTFYAVWTHARSDYDERGFHDDGRDFRNDFRIEPLGEREGENRFLLKVSYWLPV